MQRMAGVRAGAHLPHPLPWQLPDHAQSRACQAPEEQRQGKAAVSLRLLCPQPRLQTAGGSRPSSQSPSQARGVAGRGPRPWSPNGPQRTRGM
uniref:Transmembrane protein 120B n=1 Tax=Cercocebus atys TaxID=9531 RepID=A0A2K5P3H1_CERAT